MRMWALGSADTEADPGRKTVKGVGFRHPEHLWGLHVPAIPGSGQNTLGLPDRRGERFGSRWKRRKFLLGFTSIEHSYQLVMQSIASNYLSGLIKGVDNEKTEQAAPG